MKNFTLGNSTSPKAPDLFSELEEPIINGKENNAAQTQEPEINESEREECLLHEVHDLLLFLAELTVKEYEKTQKGDHHGSGIER